MNNTIEVLENKIKEKYEWYRVVPFKLIEKKENNYDILIKGQREWVSIEWFPIGVLNYSNNNINIHLYDEQDLAIKYDLALNSDEIFNFYKHYN